MRNLFLIDGASSTGKSAVLSWIRKNNAGDVGIVIKGATRRLRDYERSAPADLELLALEEFNARKFDYRYRYSGGEYGVHRSSISEQLTQNDNVFLVVRSPGIMRRISEDYDFVNVVPVFIHTDRSVLRNRLRRGRGSKHVHTRLRRADEAFRDYCRHPEVYREIIIDNASRNSFNAVIERVLLGKYSTGLGVNPQLISVMMSYDKSMAKYYSAIAEGVYAASPNLECRRVKDGFGSIAIAQEFRELIARSRCVIVDLSQDKRDVYYELGYIHATRKACLIVAKEGTLPSFYPRGHQLYFYASPVELRNIVQEQLRGILRGVPI